MSSFHTFYILTPYLLLWDENNYTARKKNYVNKTELESGDIIKNTNEPFVKPNLNNTTRIRGIYKIVNKVNQKYYVGRSVNIRGRWRTHKRSLGLSIHQNKHLQSAWNKYGSDNFEFIIVELVEGDIRAAEQRYLDICKREKTRTYNKVYVAHEFTEEHCARISKARLGEKCLWYDPTIYTFVNRQTGKRIKSTKNAFHKAHDGHRYSFPNEKKRKYYWVCFSATDVIPKKFTIKKWGKLSYTIAEKIRAEYRLGKTSHTKLMKKYQLSGHSISRILLNDIYANANCTRWNRSTPTRTETRVKNSHYVSGLTYEWAERIRKEYVDNGGGRGMGFRGGITIANLAKKHQLNYHTVVKVLYRSIYDKPMPIGLKESSA